MCDEAGYRFAWIGYAEHDSAKSVRPVAWSGNGEDYLSTANITWSDTERGRGPTGTAIRTGRIDYQQDFMIDPRILPWRDNALQFGFRSSAALPLRDEGGAILGALTIYSDEANFITPEEMRLLDQLAGDLTFGIEALRNRALRNLAEDELRKTLVEREKLIRELFHRVKNNLSVVTALLALQAEASGDANIRMAFAAAQGRVHTIAMVHEELYETKDLSRLDLKAYFARLIAETMGKYETAGGRIALDLELENVSVLMDTAIPCGLILNEIISNSLAHAFPGSRRGRIHVRLQGMDDGEILLEAGDDGIGLAPGFDPRRDGRLGLKTVFGLAENQLGARLRLSPERGLSYELRFKDDSYRERV